MVCCLAFSVSAESITVPDVIKYTRTTSVRNAWMTTDYVWEYTSNSAVGLQHTQDVTANHGIPPGTDLVTIWDFVKIENNDGSCFIPMGGETTVSLYDVYLDLWIDYPEPFSSTGGEHMTTYVEYMDGTWEYTGVSVSCTHNVFSEYDIIFKFTPIKDVKLLELQIRRIEFVEPVDVHSDMLICSGMGYNTTSITISQLSDEYNALQGIGNQFDNFLNSEALPEDSPIKDITDNVIDIEEELLGMGEAITVGDSITDIISQAVGSLSSFFTGFLVMGLIIDKFAMLPVISWCLYISLSLGIFATIVNLVINLHTSSMDAKQTKNRGIKNV